MTVQEEAEWIEDNLFDITGNDRYSTYRKTLGNQPLIKYVNLSEHVLGLGEMELFHFQYISQV